MTWNLELDHPCLKKAQRGMFHLFLLGLHTKRLRSYGKNLSKKLFFWPVMCQLCASFGTRLSRDVVFRQTKRSAYPRSCGLVNRLTITWLDCRWACFALANLNLSRLSVLFCTCTHFAMVEVIQCHSTAPLYSPKLSLLNDTVRLLHRKASRR